MLSLNESPFSDFSRLARFLTGKSIALVLGGGGARGGDAASGGARGGVAAPGVLSW